MVRGKRLFKHLSVISFALATGVVAWAQDNALRITPPNTGDTVNEGQPFRISVAADDAVRFVGIIGWNPLPYARAVGHNLFEMTIPNTVPLGKYNLTAVGVTTAEVASEPVTIQVENDTRAVGLHVQPLISFTTLGDTMPLRVIAELADGSKLDVTHSQRTTYESRDMNIVRVDDQAQAVIVGPGRTAILIGYRGAPYAATVILGPGTDLAGRIRPSGAQESVVVGSSTTSAGYRNGITIVGISGYVTPGNQIQIHGSAFGSQQGKGFVTIADVRAQVIGWSDREITLLVPKFSASGRTTTVSVHQGESSEDFRVILPLAAPHP